MDTQITEVGKRISKIRTERGYTREKLAEMSDISTQFLADIEKGRKSMTVATLRQISAALHISTDYIVNGTVPAEDNFLIISILDSLSEKNRKQAEKILTIFAESVNRND